MPVQRLNYFHYQFLQEQDFKDEQAYHVAMRRRHNREFHTWGRVRGLDVSFMPGERQVTISPGIAVDSLGREIVFEANHLVDLQAHAGQTVYLTVAYKEENTNPTTQPGVTGSFTRTTESFETPRVRSAAGPPSWDTSLDLILARITLNANPPDGAVTAVDFSERTEAGAKIGQTDLPALRFTVPGHGGSEWPRIAGNNVSGPGTGIQGLNVDASVAAFSGGVTVAQNLSVQGDLNVRGVVNKVDELAIKDSIIRVNQYQPPTPTPVVVNGGLEVFRGGTAPNAQIIWDETADVWKAGVAPTLENIATEGRFHATTGHRHTGAAGDGPAISHGNLTAVLAANATLTDAVSDKHVSNLQAKGWQDHVNVSAGNPHGTTAAQVGALAAADYGFSSVFEADVPFNSSMASGATQTVNTNFRTRFLWITGYINAVLAGQNFGALVNGYADLRTSIRQHGNGPVIHRTLGIPYVFTTGNIYNACCGASFFDLTVTPNRIEHVNVSVSSVTNTAFVLMLARSVPATTTVAVNPIAEFHVFLRFFCFG